MRLVRGVVITGAVLLLAGCSSTAQPPSATDLSGAIGNTLLQVREGFSAQVSPVYDLSPGVLDKPSTFSAGSPGGQWVVIAACPAQSPNPSADMAVGVVPQEDYNATIERNARDGRYDKLLTECK
jgi:hypothetical protein